MSEIKVGVIGDWSRCARGNYWEEALGEIDSSCEVTFYPIGDLVVRPPGTDDPESLQRIGDQDVLIINWDAINGDPDFGADRALRWLTHRRPEIILWLRRGNVLLVESQAVLGVPCQNAYDAVAGRGELPVSGIEHCLRPLDFKDKLGPSCRKTKHFPEEGGFENVPERLVILKDVNRKQMFPATSTNLLTNEIDDTHWSQALYRGWFRRALPGWRELGWVSLVETEGRGFLRNHSTLVVAKVGRGAIFASTMMLATTGQNKLIKAILGCARRNTQHLPSPPSLIDRTRRYWQGTVGLLAGAGAGHVAADAPTLAERAKELLNHTGNFEDYTKEFLIVAGMVLFDVARRIARHGRRWFRDIVGY